MRDFELSVDGATTGIVDMMLVVAHKKSVSIWGT